MSQEGGEERQRGKKQARGVLGRPQLQHRLQHVQRRSRHAQAWLAQAELHGADDGFELGFLEGFVVVGVIVGVVIVVTIIIIITIITIITIIITTITAMMPMKYS